MALPSDPPADEMVGYGMRGMISVVKQVQEKWDPAEVMWCAGV